MKIFSSRFARVPQHQKFHYEPRYVKNEEEPLDQRIKFERGALLKRTNTLHKYKKPIFSHKEKLSTSRKRTLMFLLLAQMGLIYFIVTNMHKGWSYIVFPMIFLLGLLILFIRTNNQR